jgi:hypothetical protein
MSEDVRTSMDGFFNAVWHHQIMIAFPLKFVCKYVIRDAYSSDILHIVRINGRDTRSLRLD